LRRGRAAKGEYFADDTANWLTLDMDEEIDGFSNLGFGVGEGRSSQKSAARGTKVTALDFAVQ